tara:strand:- start:224 stop:715 length:492 start_codon:yes stop_codon:yes gene_type:complete
MSKRKPNKSARSRRGKAKDYKAKQRLKAQKDAVLRGAIERNACTLKLRLGHPDSNNPSDYIDIEAIIDTGATNCAIRKDIADRLNLPVVDTQGVQGINGVVHAPVVIMTMVVEDKGTVAGRQIRATVLDQMADPMLFGMEGMMGGVLKVDTIRGTWEWRIKGL